MIIRNGNFVCDTFLKRAKGVRRKNLATSQFHWHWRISTLIKYSSLLAVGNETNVSIIWSQNNEKLSFRFCQKKNGYDRSWTNATLIRGLLTMIIWHSYSWLSLKVQDIYTLPFFQKVFLSHFFANLFFAVPMWSTRFSRSKVTTTRKQRASESTIAAWRPGAKA